MILHNDKVISAAKKLIEFFNSNNPFASRLIGSTAIAICCPNNIVLWNSLRRKSISDVDIVTTPTHFNYVYKSLSKLGYLPCKRENMVSTTLFQRPLFISSDKTFYVEIFISPLILHHKLILDWKNCPNQYTVNLTDLFLSKLQFEFKETDKDEFQKQMQAQLIDLTVLLSEIPLNDGKPTTLLVRKISILAGDNWPLFKTLHDNLALLQNTIVSDFSVRSSYSFEKVTEKISILLRSLETVPKTSRWKTRSFLQKALPRLPVGNPVFSPLNDDRWSKYVKH